MTGYVRKDTTNNIADGNVINAADLDSEFDGVQAAFNASTGHKHDGTASEGATINSLGPTQDVTISASLIAPKTTNFVDIGSSGLKFKDMFLAGNSSIGGTLAVTGVATFTAQPILSSLTASRAVFSDGSKGLVSNAITGTGNVVMSASPTLTGTIGGASLTLSSLTSGRVTYAGTSGLLQDSANLTFNGTTLTANTLNLTNALGTTYGGTGLTSFTANGVVYASSSSALATGSALTFDGAGTLVSGVGGTGTNNSLLRLNGSDASSYGSYIQFQRNSVNKWTIGTDSGINGGTSDDLTIFGTASQRFYANSTEQMRLTSTGLGIGTSSPGYKLQTVGQAYFGTGGGTTQIRLGNDTAANYWSLGRDNVTTGDLVFQNQTTEQMRLDASGNLGIGVTTPSTYGKLVVWGGNAFIQSTTAGVGAKITLSDTNNAVTVESSPVGVATDMIFKTSTVTRMTLDNLGNLGLGVTPSAWSGLKAFEFGGVGSSLSSAANNNVFLSANAWYNGTNWRYGITAAASQYQSFSGAHIWYNAPSGTAGNAITFTQAMTLDASGNLGIGTSSPGVKLDVSDTSAQIRATSSTGTNICWGNYNNTGGSLRVGLESSSGGALLFGSTAYSGIIGTTGAYPLAFGTSATQRMALDSSGNLGIGTSSPGAKLDVFSSGATLAKFTRDLATDATLQIGADNDGPIIEASGINTMRFFTSAAERMRLDASGNLIVGGTSAVYTNTNRGNISINGASTAILGLSTGGSGRAYLYTDGSRLDLLNTQNDALTFGTNNTEQIRLDSSGNLLVGGTAARGTTVGTKHLDLFDGTAPAGTLTNGVSLYSSSGDLQFMDSAGNGYAVGFRNIPQNVQTGSYTLVLADAGKHIYRGSGTAATWTIPANSSVAYAIGTRINFINLSTTSVSIAITTDTMYLSSAGTTGTRTLARYGVAEAIKITSTSWLISGTGLT
jgi:hypothetical protein